MSGNLHMQSPKLVNKAIWTVATWNALFCKRMVCICLCCCLPGKRKAESDASSKFFPRTLLGSLWIVETFQGVNLYLTPCVDIFELRRRALKTNCAAERLCFVADLRAQHDAILVWRSTSAAQSRDNQPDASQHIPPCVVIAPFLKICGYIFKELLTK